jgi:type I restriction enzyme, S subunit
MNQDRSTTITNPQLKEGYKQTEVGVIPEDWEVKRLKHISPSQSVGLVINPSSYFDSVGSVPMLVGSHINENGIDWESANRISELSNNLLPSSRLTAGDLVTVRVGDPGLTAVVPSELDGCNCASMMIVRQHRSFVSRWLCYVMNSPFGRSQIEHVQYGTAQKQFNISDAVDFSYPVPPLPEQEAIASTLSDIDALIESLDRLLTKKRQIKQGAMQELLRSKDGWETTNLGSLGSFTKGSGVRKDESLSGSLPCIRYGEIYTKHDDYIKHFYSWISPNVAETATRLKIGDLLFSGSGETKEEIGKCVAFINDIEAYAGGDIVILRLANSNAQFMGYYLNTSPVIRQKASKGQGDAVVHIGANALATIQITIPTLEEQNEIANILSDMDAEIGAISTKLAKTRQLKQGMMHELLTGRIRLVDNTSIS